MINILRETIENFIEPLVCVSVFDEIVYEWRIGNKTLTVYKSPDNFHDYLKTDINDEMKDGKINNIDDFINLYKWVVHE